MFSFLVYRQKNLQSYWIAYWILLAILLLTQCLLTQDELFLFVNRHTNNYLDLPMNGITFIGSGWVFGAVIGLAFFYRDKRLGLLLLSTYILSTLLAQGIKHILPAIPRPQLHFAEIKQAIRLPKGAEVLKLASFPSGHSTSIAALATILAFYFRKYSIALPLLAIAFIVAFSRVYVAAHFFRDISAGIFLGTEAAAICILLFRKKLEQ
ncbi:MAG: phosphatase PAP2 family protein [Chitinophagales bacterium]|jgi:membrane-associated phospholipid phosphatase|nr:phosphatase PAP2 family protein [Chitinophagales bacterium]